MFTPLASYVCEWHIFFWSIIHIHTSSSLIKFFQTCKTCPNLFKSVQICSNLFKLDQTPLNFFKLVKSCSNLFKHIQTSSDLFKLDLISLKLSKLVWSKLFKSFQNCSNMFKHAEKCSFLVISLQAWSFCCYCLNFCSKHFCCYLMFNLLVRYFLKQNIASRFIIFSWIKIDQTCSLIELFQYWSNLSRFDKTCPNWFKYF